METQARVRVEERVAVGTGGGRPLHCDLFHPPTPPSSARGYPCVLLIHGGAWRIGDRSQLRGYGILFGRLGYLCATLEYRLTGEAPWPAQLHDVKAAVRHIRANADRLHVDPERIAVWGNSAGGQLALMLAGTPGVPEFEGEGGNAGVSSACAACIALYPPTRLHGERSAHIEVPELFAGLDREGQARRASPLQYVRPDFPPTLLIHGDRDDIVPADASVTMYQALAAAGAPVELHLYHGLPHGFDAQRRYGRQCFELAEAFLSRVCRAL